MKIFRRFLLSISLFSVLLVFAQQSQAQQLREAAAKRGVRIGSPLIHMYSDQRSLYEQVLSYSSVIVLWEETHYEEGRYDWVRPDEATSFARDNNWGMMGTALMWGDDKHIDQWVIDRGTNAAESIMNSHIETVMGRYKNDFDAWVVVNEAMTYDGKYRDCHWNRAMTGEYIAKAFIKAEAEDPTAALIYNDYDIEKYRAKFDAMKDMITYVRSLGGRVDGVGWQLHVLVDDVLAADFDLANRMQEISDMGLKNYVTELDIRIDENKSEDWEKQRDAYAKIVDIFLDNPTHGDTFQTWGLGDRYSWYNDEANRSDPGRNNLVSWPLPFNEKNEKKPGYWGMLMSFLPQTQLRIDNTEVQESDGTFTMNVSLTQASSDPVEVIAYTRPVTARGGTDYYGKTEKLIFQPGETSTPFTVTLVDDGISEGVETLEVRLSNPINASIESGQAVVTIRDNDDANSPKLDISSTPVAEDRAVANVEVRLSPASANTVSVLVFTQSVSATPGRDYYGGTATLTFSPGEALKNFDVPILDDSEKEATETISVRLKNATGDARIAIDQTLLEILDND